LGGKINPENPEQNINADVSINVKLVQPDKSKIPPKPEQLENAFVPIVAKLVLPDKFSVANPVLPENTLMLIPITGIPGTGAPAGVILGIVNAPEAVPVIPVTLPELSYVRVYVIIHISI